MFLQGGDSNYAMIASHMRTLSPIPALLQLVGDETPGATGAIESVDLISRYVASAIVLSLVGSLICIQRLNYSLMDRSRSQGLITDERSRSLRAARRVMYLVDPQKRKSGISWFLNPVMVKEFRSRQFGRLHWLLRMVAGCAVMSLLLTLATTMGTLDWGVEKVGGIMIVAQVGLILVLTPGISGAMIAGEMESGGWNMLRATPLSTRRVVSGKLMSVSITLALVLCASLPGYGIIMVIKPVLQTQVAQVIVSLALTAAVAMLVSATVSSFFRSTAAATTVSYGLLIFFTQAQCWSGSTGIRHSVMRSFSEFCQQTPWRGHSMRWKSTGFGCTTDCWARHGSFPASCVVCYCWSCPSEHGGSGNRIESAISGSFNSTY